MVSVARKIIYFSVFLISFHFSLQFDAHLQAAGFPTTQLLSGHPWNDWWIPTLVIIGIISTILTLNRRRIRKVEAKRKNLEIQVQEKTLTMQALQNALNEVERLTARLQVENVYLKDEIKLSHNFDNIMTVSENMKKILKCSEQVAVTDATVLLTGESGTGKELIARAIHNISRRKDRALVKVDCAVLPPNLIESELFGHVKGAFTGAVARKIGRFEIADAGTLFLDEIGDLPLELQTKLLRILQDGEFERVGSPCTLKVDVRVIAATNKNLSQEIRSGQFREDLFYRLNVFPIHLPPLRERKEDIPVLVRHFIHKYSAKTNRHIETISKSDIKQFEQYSWPGNIRELENVIERAVILTRGTQLNMDDWFHNGESPHHQHRFMTLEENERAHIMKALEFTGWRVSGKKGAASLLGMNSQTLASRMKKLNIKRTERVHEIS
ncbi:MAG: sigma 54-interacting transcriptional regulator [candidate division KSB1 bacterium]|jgi:transcriptional regulator with GAF, ATPase, and Fis domain|nr:sigma 54-interacting transcriptional regulator [candidate division KSB1 bacterium]